MAGHDETLDDRMDSKGAWVRKKAHFAEGVVEQGGEHPPEKDRYHLYVSLACPWASGTLTMLKLKGLDHVIGHSIVAPTWAYTRPEEPEDKHAGWWFREPGAPAVPNILGHGSFDHDDANIPDTVNGCKTMRDIYDLSGAPRGTTYSTPVLFDKKTNTIVNNESAKILRIFNDCFNKFAKNPTIDVYPAATAKETDQVHDDIYDNVLNGVYKAGFARTQEAYDSAVHAIFECLDRAENRLESQRFLTGNELTWVDLRFYHNLVRFDPVYTTYFHCNIKRIGNDYPNLLGYIRDIYQSYPSVRGTTNIRHIKMHYYSSHPIYNTFGIIPADNGPVLTTNPHGREKFQ